MSHCPLFQVTEEFLVRPRVKNKDLICARDKTIRLRVKKEVTHLVKVASTTEKEAELWCLLAGVRGPIVARVQFYDHTEFRVGVYLDGEARVVVRDYTDIYGIYGYVLSTSTLFSTFPHFSPLITFLIDSGHRRKSCPNLRSTRLRAACWMQRLPMRINGG